MEKLVNFLGLVSYHRDARLINCLHDLDDEEFAIRQKIKIPIDH
jgi:hypothetical protein